MHFCESPSSEQKTVDKNTYICKFFFNNKNTVLLICTNVKQIEELSFKVYCPFEKPQLV